jgi:hypothetical protein
LINDLAQRPAILGITLIPMQVFILDWKNQ